MPSKIDKLQFIVDSVTSMIGYWDCNLYNQFANSAYANWFGLNSSEIVGQHICAVIGEERYRLNLPYIEGVLRGEPQEFEREIPCLNGSGVRHSLAQYFPHFVDGQVVGFTAQVTDITAVKSSQLALADANASLEHRISEQTKELYGAKLAAEVANRAKTLFIGNMSHEMRTPLHQISGVAAMFRRDSLTEKQMYRLDMLDNAANRLDSVIGGILTLVDIEAGSTEVKLAPIDMAQVVGEVVAKFADTAVNKTLQLQQQVEPLPFRLLGDAKHLTTILSCFCGNAITFSKNGTISIRANRCSEQAGSVMVRFEVQDEGIGIAPANVSRLFEDFEQEDNSHTRKYGGTGVGLAIVRRLAKLMGGDAGCDSLEGKGSTFWATARLVKAPPPEIR
jgi:PAS domain S-box-containing protein